MTDQPMVHDTTVPDMLDQPVGVGDTVVAAFTEMTTPTLRVGVVLGFVERTTTTTIYNDARTFTLMQVQWTSMSGNWRLKPAKPTKIEVEHRRFLRIPALAPSVVAS